ncbi:MAG: hypothetical protein B7Y41_13485 [Hydrogenophilales bacterium 28-61-23]|nr:MAG: hypothetical protein B7Y41_13485 [Hydrogenophilales bacterium 28-61-23]
MAMASACSPTQPWPSASGNTPVKGRTARSWAVCNSASTSSCPGQARANSSACRNAACGDKPSSKPRTTAAIKPADK